MFLKTSIDSDTQP